MESVYNFSNKELLAFALVFMRMSAFVMTMPIFGVGSVPSSIKVLLALGLSFVIFPTVGWQQMDADPESFALVTLVVKEVFVGLTFGFLSRAFFIALTMAGQLISISLGISSGQLYNPTLGESSAAFDQFYGMMASLIFLGINGHHLLISAIADSYTLISVGQLTVELTGMNGVAHLVSTAMAIALKASSPVMVSILFVNVGMALIGRAVPQINILITSLPVNTLVGLFIILFTMPVLLWSMPDIVGVTHEEVMKIMKSM
jgi:flagellar biosynthesis protein FliR